MDVDKVSFYPLLPDLLTDISQAHFVAIDLELSGVPSKGVHSVGKPSLQQRYLETKEAAERYQILQFGLTCVEQDVANQKYILKPYNFDLSPVIAERGLDIERIFSYQSGAAEFLLKVGFDMGRPFTHGVPYLSRVESREARNKHVKRQDKSSLADIQIKPTEVESLAFLDRVRSEIRGWLTSPNAEGTSYVNIAPVGAEVFKNASESPAELSRFEKRLVHQLVRAEFPDLVTVSKRGFVQIIRFDREREDQIAAGRKRDSDERINRQKGFRWVIEALLGSDLHKLDLQECAKDPLSGEQVFADMDEYRAQFHRAHALMQNNPRVLVGHNCFLDFIYIYRTFIGPLPDTVEEYQRKLHKLWPTIIDTKYMSTHNCGDINPVSSLEQIAEQMSFEKTPRTETAPEHSKYEDTESFHEAGYDSYLTAGIAVRLSSKLEKAGQYVDLDAHDTTKLDPWTLAGRNQNPDYAARDLASLTLSEPSTTSISRPATAQEGFTPSTPGLDWKRNGDPTVVGTSGPHDPNPQKLKHRYTPLPAGRVKDGMPGFKSDFWRVYGNRMRVFGTEEAVFVLEDQGYGEDGSEEEMVGGQGGVGV
ncbi:hypothetical protein LTR62_002799 [Meristemomyces frigidus]|uniref:CAF1-domain-containing protein n=1 Tax=Meristemomyces frigidus TaxID=1508187 RepID=A0AAN7TP57_9PEZI|nr:hypothetical protein LTR62_002799 [Meristemomyces frigidus]